MLKQFYFLLERSVSATKLGAIACLLAISTLTYGQTRTVSGTVIDNTTNEPVPGATVVIKGSTVGTVTDINGSYSIQASASDVLVFSFVGFQTQEATVGSRSVVDVGLDLDLTSLEEVVVIGYGTQTKKDVTGAVTAISADDFNPGLISTPEQLFDGKVTGIDITPNGGSPGANSNIIIRGVSTLAGNIDPLIVVDGFPLDGRQVLPGALVIDPLGAAPQRSPLTFLNPNDIASLTVLKDASATAIYGSRGANGVIVITTKSAKNKGTFLDYGSSISVGSLRGEYDIFDRGEFISRTTPDSLSFSPVNFGGNTDFVDEILESNFISHDHYLAFGSAGETGDYVFSVGYSDQEGLIRGSGLERLTARLNARQDLIDGFLSTNVSLQVTALEDDIAPVGPAQQATGNLVTGVISQNPTIPLTHLGNPDSLVQRNQQLQYIAQEFRENDPNTNADDVNPGDTLVFPIPEDFNNPRAILDNYSDQAQTIRFLGNAAITANFTKEFTGTVRIGIDRALSERRTTLGEEFIGRAGTSDVFGINIFSTNNLNSLLFDGLLEYKKNYGDHDVKALLGYSWQEFEQENTYTAGINITQDTVFVPNFVDQLGFGAFTALTDIPQAVIGGLPSRSSQGNFSTLQSFFGRAEYAYLGRYLATATLRVDGSSRFGEDDQYGFFPSVALGWVLSEEDFIPSAFSNLKLRFGWGITGNQPANPLAARGLQTITPTGAGTFTLLDTQTASPSLRWEESNQINVGIDFGVLGDRIIGTLDYFNKTTEDFIVPVPNLTTGQVQVLNLPGEINNSGLEISLSGDVVKSSDLNVNIAANFTTYFENSLEGFSGIRPISTGFVAAPGIQGGGSPTQRIEDGIDLGQWFLNPVEGFNEEAGGFVILPPQFVDADGIADYNFGVTITADYKGFDFSTVFSGTGGHDVLNVTTNAFLQRSRLTNGLNNASESHFTRIPGPETVSPPSLGSTSLESGDFVRWSNISLGYTFAPDSWDWVESVRVYVSGQNIALWSDYSGLDPQVAAQGIVQNGQPTPTAYGIDNGNFPRPKQFTFGVQASF